jgi:hypothetical protein
MPSGRACACANVKDATNKAMVLNCIFVSVFGYSHGVLERIKEWLSLAGSTRVKVMSNTSRKERLGERDVEKE